MHAAGSGWFKGHEVSYCSGGKWKCCGAIVIIFTYFSNSIEVLRASRCSIISYKIEERHNFEKEIREQS